MILMKNDDDTDLIRLFDEMPEPAHNEIWVKGVMKKIAFYRFSRRTTRMLLALAGLFILFQLAPWFVDFTGSIVFGSQIFARGIIEFLTSPAGCAIVGGVGLPFFLRMIIVRP